MTTFNLTCEAVETMLHEYLDETLEPWVRTSIEEHLGECARCTGLARELRNIVREGAALPALLPERDVWPGIAGRIGAPVIDSEPVAESEPLPPATERIVWASDVFPPISEPPVLTREPPVLTREPPVLTREPPVLTREPPVLTREPPVLTREPPVLTSEPPRSIASYHRPQVRRWRWRANRSCLQSRRRCPQLRRHMRYPSAAKNPGDGSGWVWPRLRSSWSPQQPPFFSPCSGSDRLERPTLRVIRARGDSRRVRDRRPSWEFEDRRRDASESHRIRRLPRRPLVSWPRH